ncbi:MAG: 50S ribosomal protein L9 [Gammaproteobacteria bacterium]|nr:50S ribosomal protein L9 [Gammaproteobacteria bacterium]MDE0283532.1 50S ribosomal protein L9 [Gammaproteobacteria bacterium]
MQVILLEKIGKLGELGQQVNVKPGYGRNYLIPNGKAVPATPENVEKFEAQRAELEKVQADSLATAQGRAEKLNELEVTLRRKVVSDDKLYGSVGINEIAAAITDSGLEVTKREISLPDGPFKSVGEYEVELHLHADVDARIKLVIAADLENAEG